MSKSLSRREFLKLGGMAFGGLALGRFAQDDPRPADPLFLPDFPYPKEHDHGMIVRVGTKEVPLLDEPRDGAVINGWRYRDQVVHVYYELHPPDAPIYYNTLWYRVWGGYIHSAHLQTVDIRFNEPLAEVAESGVLCEVTVPYTTAYQYSTQRGWTPWRGSRLYYDSTHWATAVEQGPDGKAWYQITNELSASEIYYVPAIHLRPIPAEELAPISPDVPPEKKRIEVSINEQRLRAYENGEEVYSARVSTGIPSRTPAGDLPTATPQGSFRIYSKMPSKHMGSVAGGPEVEDNGGFSLPGVPWTCFFKLPGGYALHGTYWHNNFGLQMSHGCVNMRNEDARWIFRWTTPVYEGEIKDHSDWERTGYGTTVEIF